MLIRVRKPWEIPETETTAESAYRSRPRSEDGPARIAGAGLTRRSFLRGLAGVGGLCGWSTIGGPLYAASEEKGGETKLYPAKRNPAYKLDRPITPAEYATSYNNFYEFSFSKQGVKPLAQRMVTDPWSVEVTGLVAKPGKFDVGELIKKIGLEERLYRFRCVEAWAMAVPWTGFPLSKLLDLVEPTSDAKFVRFLTFYEPKWGPGFQATEYPWPYFEGLTMAEARNELTLVATGLYGKPMPKQNGAPIRLVVPWKYGFKSIKSIVKIELVKEQPSTFWSSIVPNEYDFRANVDPTVDHPRWSQASERMIDTGERRKTLPYNGYGELVAHLYKKKPAPSGEK